MTNLDWVTQIEIELHNKCNLRCPLCVRQNKDYQDYFKTQTEIPLEDLVEALGKFPNLKLVHLVGNSSEPTLYSNLIELIEWLKYQGIVLMISTNASTRNEDFWMKLGSILTSKDEIRFAIDGATQITYEKYRQGGDLKKIIRNVLAFNEGSKINKLDSGGTRAFCVLQIIKFLGNQHIYSDEIEAINNIFKERDFKFDYIYKLNTNSEVQTNEYLRFPLKEKVKQTLYKRFYEDIFKLDYNERIKQLDCYSEKGFIYINHRGEFCTCCDRYEEFLERTNNLKIKDFESDNFNFYYRYIYNNTFKNNTCLKNCNKKLLEIEHDRDHPYNQTNQTNQTPTKTI